MPQILVLTDLPDEAESTVVYRERISLSDLDSTYFSGQLVERVGWAVQDADRFEREAADGRARLRPRHGLRPRQGGVASPDGVAPPDEIASLSR